MNDCSSVVCRDQIYMVILWQKNGKTIFGSDKLDWRTEMHSFRITLWLGKIQIEGNRVNSNTILIPKAVSMPELPSSDGYLFFSEIFLVKKHVGMCLMLCVLIRNNSKKKASGLVSLHLLDILRGKFLSISFLLPNQTLLTFLILLNVTKKNVMFVNRNIKNKIKNCFKLITTLTVCLLLKV